MDLLVQAGYLLPHSHSKVKRNQCLAIKNGIIIDVGLPENITCQYEAPTVVDALDQLVMPGLINAHTHSPMAKFRGFADDLPLMEWLHEHIFPAETKLTADQVYWATLLAAIEMIKGGTTTFCDMYHFSHQVGLAAQKIGMRAIIGEGLFQGISTNFGADINNGYAYTQDLITQWRDDPLIRVAVSPHAPYTCTAEILTRCGEIAQAHSVPLHIHLSETAAEVKQILQTQGATPVQWLDALGILSPTTIAAHCVHLNERDVEVLSLRDVKVAHCPESNMKLASGIAPVTQMRAHGVVVGLGTDGCASNNDLNMWGEMDVCAKLQKVQQLDPTALPAPEVLAMATTENSLVLGYGEQLGRLEPGKLADLIVLDINQAHWLPHHNTLSHLVYAAQPSDVCHSIINGKLVMRDRKILNLDENQVLRRFMELS